MPPSRPTYPTQRAFVVQLHAKTNVAQSEVWGRVNILCSGADDLFPDRGAASAVHSTRPDEPDRALPGIRRSARSMRHG